MLVTLEVSHVPMSTLKEVALENKKLISVTLDVSQEPISWLKEDASPNIPSIVVMGNIPGSDVHIERSCTPKHANHVGNTGCIP
jgi:hypothetical protein